MRKQLYIILIYGLLASCNSIIAQTIQLKILSINAWSGTDYTGFFNYGMYEPEERREIRLNMLINQIRNENPDVVCLQEANKVGAFTSRLADSLDYDEIHQICNAGIKLGQYGLPNNFKEGISILAKKNLNLKNYDVWKLSGSFGLYGDLFSLHFDESTFGLVARITINNKPLLIVNVHLTAAPPFEEEFFNKHEELLKLNNIQEKEIVLAQWKQAAGRRIHEVENLLKYLHELPKDVPFLIAGDFNSTINSAELKRLLEEGKLVHRPIDNSLTTWDPDKNENISYSTQTTDLDGNRVKGLRMLSSVYDSIPRQIDHIFLSELFKDEDIQDYKIVLNNSVNGVHTSDHFGILANINLPNAQAHAPEELKTITSKSDSEIEGLPIVMYDTDIGFGYGVKTFFLNQLKMNESFDMVLFNSTKGERWYRFVFSLPDFEIRQHKIYPFSVDLIIDYDKMINNNFFGIGSGSSYNDLENYTKEPLELSLNISRGFTESFVGLIGLKYRTVKSYNFSGEGKLKNFSSSFVLPKAYYSSLYIAARYDTRNSFINPSSGVVFNGEVEFASKNLNSNVNFFRWSGVLQYYTTLWYPKTIFALRLLTNNIVGENLPLQLHLPIGGTWTLRGSPIERFLDKSIMLCNAELRMPLYWRFHTVLALDAGKVFSSINKISLRNWISNPTLGLRFYMDTFVVRLDIGLGRETTGLYFNFGHLF